MEKQEHSQLEFFSQGQGEIGLSQPSPRFDFLGSMRSHEKKILLLIAFLIIGAIAFSLGVEKGKHMANFAPAPVVKPVALARQEIAPKTQPVYLQKQALAAAQPITSIQAYTIQVASYLSRDSAEAEALSFRKRGLSVLILSKGKYSVLCVGNFSSRDAAQMTLSELKKQRKYQDCTIRRL